MQNIIYWQIGKIGKIGKLANWQPRSNPSRITTFCAKVLCLSLYPFLASHCRLSSIHRGHKYLIQSSNIHSFCHLNIRQYFLLKFLLRQNQKAGQAVPTQIATSERNLEFCSPELFSTELLFAKIFGSNSNIGEVWRFKNSQSKLKLKPARRLIFRLEFRYHSGYFCRCCFSCCVENNVFHNYAQFPFPVSQAVACLLSFRKRRPLCVHDKSNKQHKNAR